MLLDIRRVCYECKYPAAALADFDSRVNPIGTESQTFELEDPI